MKRLNRILSVGLSLALCAALVAPAMAHIVTIEGGNGPKKVDTVQQGVEMIAESASQAGTITMDTDEEVTGSGVTIHGGNVTLDLNGQTLANRGSNAITVAGGGLTLQDSSEKKSGRVEATVSGVAVADGTFNMEGGAVSGKSYGVSVRGGEANISGGAVSGNFYGVSVDGGEANISGGAVSGKYNGVSVHGGKANISGGAVRGDSYGVSVEGGEANISGGAVSGKYGVYVYGGEANISGGAVSGNYDGVSVYRGEANISGGAVSGDHEGVHISYGKTDISGDATVTGGDTGMYVYGGEADISDDATVTGGDTGVKVYGDGTLTMNGGTVGSTTEGGWAVEANYGSAQAVLNKGTIYGEVSGNVTVGIGVTIKPAPYVKPAEPERPDQPDEPERPDRPDVDIDDPDVPLAGPVSLQELLEELHRRSGASGEVLAWAADNGLADADADGTELVTVGALRAILSRYAEAFGTNAVAVPDLTTLTGEDEDLVLNCGEVLAEFFGEE